MDAYTHTFGSRLNSYYDVRRRGHIKFYVRKYPNGNVKLHDLAKDGFHYEGDGDVVRCCVCKIRITDWAVGDDPAQVHKAVSYTHLDVYKRQSEDTPQ